VFWPGELSAHIRDARRWQGFPFGTRSRGVVAAVELDFEPARAGVAVADSARFAALDREMFRGDLGPWNEPGWTRGASDGAAPRRPAGRIEVDASCPGRTVIERFFDRRPPAQTRASARARLFYLDAPIHDPDSLALGVAAYVRRAMPALRARAEAL